MKLKEPMSNKINSVLILAAGFGTRLKPLTDETPKALIKVGGEPMLKRTTESLKSFNFENIFINTHYHADQINTFIHENGIKATTLFEPEILETGGTIKHFAITNPDVESLLVINCDSLFSNLSTVIQDLIKMWDATKMDGLFTLVPSYKNNTSADFEVNHEKKLVYPIINQSNACTFTSPYIIKPKLLLGAQQSKFSIIKDFVYPNLHALPNMYGLVTECNWIDIGTPKDLEKANKLFA